MQIQYSNKVVERQCTELKQAKKDLSDKVAKKLHMLINFIESADNLSSVLAFPRYSFHKLRGERSGQYAIDIDGRKSSYRLLVAFNEEDELAIFSKPAFVTIIQIVEVSKHYE